MKSATVFWMGIAALALVVAAWAAHASRLRVETIEKGPLFPGLMSRVNDVAEIEVETNDGAYRVVRADDRWIIPSKDGYEARPTKAKEVVQKLADLQIIEAKTSDPAMYSHLGLTEPSEPDSAAMIITLRDAAGERLAALHRGGYLENDAFTRWFVRRVGEDQAWYVEGGVPEVESPLDWIHRRIVQAPRTRTVSVEIYRPDGQRILAVRTAPDSRDAQATFKAWTFSETPSDYEPEIENAPFWIAQAASYVGLEDVVGADAIPWPAGDAYTTVVRTVDGLIVEIQTADIGPETWARVSARAAAPDAMPPSHLVRGDAPGPDPVEKAAEINDRVDGFAFRLSEVEARGLRGRPRALGGPDATTEPQIIRQGDGR